MAGPQAAARLEERQEQRQVEPEGPPGQPGAEPLASSGAEARDEGGLPQAEVA